MTIGHTKQFIVKKTLIVMPGPQSKINRGYIADFY